MENGKPNKRMQEVLLAYGVAPQYIPLALNYFEHIRENSKDQERCVVEIFANYFELSKDWLDGNSSSAIVQLNHHHSLQQCILTLIHCKRSGWKPKIVFVKSVLKHETAPDLSYFIFIELLKTTKTGMKFTVFKPWTTQHSEKILLLCQKVGLYYQGLNISDLHYEALTSNNIIPVVALKDPLSLWHPEEVLVIDHSHHLEETSVLIEELSIGALEPTSLT